MIWKGDHVETLTPDEYHFWMLHPLPFGWAILSAPCDPATPRIPPTTGGEHG